MSHTPNTLHVPKEKAGFFSTFRSFLPEIFTLLLVFGMVFSAEILQEKEIIFPEITALTIGYLLAPKRSWNTTGIRLIVLITFCAILGLVFVRFLPFPTYVKIIFAFILCRLILAFSQTSFAPLISAVILPILMGSDSIIYPISAFLFAVSIVLLHKVLVKLHIRNEFSYTPLSLPKKEDIKNIFIGSIVVACLTLLAFYFHTTFCIAPPLLVAFTELSNPKCGARKHPIKTILTVTLCSSIGAFFRYIFVILLDLPLTLAAVLACVFMILILKIIKIYLPPAGALTILPMLIAPSVVLFYPLQIFIGVSCFMGMALLLFPDKDKKKKQI